MLILSRTTTPPAAELIVMFIEDYSPHSVDDALRVVLSLFGTRIDRRPPPRPSASDRVARVAAEKQRDAAAVTPGAVRARGYTRGIAVAAGMAAGVTAAAAELVAVAGSAGGGNAEPAARTQSRRRERRAGGEGKRC